MIAGREGTPDSAGAMPPIVFTDCNMMPLSYDRHEQPNAQLAAAAGAGAEGAKPATKRREVKVNGKRVKTIDVHAHCVIPETLKLLGHF